MSVLGIGIDFGTSNSTVALFDGRELSYVPVDPASRPPDVMPTALYLDRQLRARVGAGAIEAYMRQNADRAIELAPEAVGEVEITVTGGSDEEKFEGPRSEGGTITERVAVHALTDRALPGRLFRGVKRWLGNARLERVRVFHANYRLVALVTPVLVELSRSALARAGSRRVAIRVGRPVRFEGRTVDASDVAAKRLLEACGHAGLVRPMLYPEPVAATLSYLYGAGADGPETVLAFDFGGGTLDLSVVRAGGGSFELLATHGIPLGGDEIDRALVRQAIFAELGQGVRVSEPRGPELVTAAFEFDRFAERLLNWPLAYELNRPELRERIVQGIREGGDTAQRLRRLHALVTGNHAYRVFRAVERAKVELSTRQQTTVRVPELDLIVPLTRARLEKVLAPHLDEIRGCVERTLESAGLDRSEVSRVVRTGGSSRIPAVVRLLDELFPGRVVEHDPFTSIAAGLALAAQRGDPAPATP